jgi:hypothetical protein
MEPQFSAYRAWWFRKLSRSVWARFQGALRVPLDSLEEFKVTTSNSDADTGISSGGQVSLVTKSGTNSIHGTLYEYYRPGILRIHEGRGACDIHGFSHGRNFHSHVYGARSIDQNGTSAEEKMSKFLDNPYVVPLQATQEVAIMSSRLQFRFDTKRMPELRAKAIAEGVPKDNANKLKRAGRVAQPFAFFAKAGAFRLVPC